MCWQRSKEQCDPALISERKVLMHLLSKSLNFVVRVPNRQRGIRSDAMKNDGRPEEQKVVLQF